jgi:hypothetical protein
MASTATKLFAGSHHQSFQDAHFKTAGNDIISPVVNINFNARELTSEQLDPRTDASVRPVRANQGWGRIFEQISGFFGSPEHRGALVHGATTAEGGIASLIQVQYPVRNTPSQESTEDAANIAPSTKDDKTGHSGHDSTQPQDDVLVVRTQLNPPRA